MLDIKCIYIRSIRLLDVMDSWGGIGVKYMLSTCTYWVPFTESYLCFGFCTGGYAPSDFPPCARLGLFDLTGSCSDVAHDCIPMFQKQVPHKWFGIEISHLIRGINIFYISFTL